MQNEGKLFEQDIKKSVSSEYWLYRFKDGTGNFAGGKNENVRFQATNICDFLVMTNEYLFLLELKSHKGTSIPFNCIRENQIEEMSKIEHLRVKSYFILNFRDKEKTYGIEAKKLKEYIEISDRKSVPFDWCRQNGIEITGERKKVRYKYNMNKFFNEISINNKLKN
jgi:recombination protein U